MVIVTVEIFDSSLYSSHKIQQNHMLRFFVNSENQKSIVGFDISLAN